MLRARSVATCPVSCRSSASTTSGWRPGSGSSSRPSGSRSPRWPARRPISWRSESSRPTRRISSSSSRACSSGGVPRPLHRGSLVAEYLKQAAPWASDSSDDVKQTVSEMLSRIERGGIEAVRDYSRRLDDWDPPSFVVDDATIRRAADELSPELQEHIAYAQDQVRAFARLQRETMGELEVELRPGVVLGHKHIPVEGVGSYVPGGRYPMLASSFMTVLVPKVAGVPRVVACAPPWHGEGIHPAMLYAISTSGADQILCVGRVQALAMVAFGLGGVEPVDMIVGAGNAYVAEAKRQLFGRVGIDLLAGPPEILVLAADTANPQLVAGDPLGQSQHA